MLSEIKYLAKDPTVKIDPKCFDHLGEGEAPCRVDTVIFINGHLVFSIDTHVAITSTPEEDKRCYKVFKTIALDAVNHSVDNESFPDKDTLDKIYDKGPTSEFWQGVHKDHVAQDGNKFPPEATHVYDINVYVLVNGYMLYNGWMMVGCSREMSCNEVPPIVMGILQDMSEKTNYPSKEDLDIIFAQ